MEQAACGERIAMARNIYRCRRRVRGRVAYYAITSSGALLGGYIRVVGQGETEAAVVAELWAALSAVDPYHLQLLASHRRATPASAADVLLLALRRPA